MPPINNTPVLYDNISKKKEMPKKTKQQQQQQEEVEELVLSGQPYKLFIESCRTAKTKETYTSSLKSYMLYRNLFSVELLVAEDPKTAQLHIITYISWLREKRFEKLTMPIRLDTVLRKVECMPNKVNSDLLEEFYQHMKDNGTSQNYQKGNLKAMIHFAKHIGAAISFIRL
jgi:hypothetical protein